jgi:cytochrome P450
MWFHYDREFKRCCAVVHDFAQQFVDKALDFRRRQALVPADEKDDGERQKYVFIDELAKATDNPTRLRDHIVNMLLAADTNPGLLSYAFYMLGRHPELWEKLRNHVLEHSCEPLTYEALTKMTYLRHFVQECGCYI